MQKKIIVLKKKVPLKAVAAAAECCDQGPQAVR